MHKNSPVRNGVARFLLTIIFIISCLYKSEAYTVSNLATEYHNGQVFITWRNPSASNLQYNVYRSIVPITLPTQLNASTLLGFVRDNSSKNVFWSQEASQDVYYKITSSAQPLASTKGLYVVTCTNNLLYYYVVTVTSLSNNSEDKTINGGNSTLLPVADLVAQPKPVFQDSVVCLNGEVKQLYVQFVNNQETPLYPAMCSTGSYGFSFFVIKRGNATKYPLFVMFQGGSPNDGEKNVNLDPDKFSNCYIIGIHDWLPVPQDGGGVGIGGYFSGYHEDFNIYSNSNTIPTTGKVKMYFQKLYWQAIGWLESQVPIDTTRIYLKGTSENGYGALITATLAPEKIAAVYAVVEPPITGAITDIYKQMWGAGSSHLSTDMPGWNGSDTILFTDLKCQDKMLNINEQRNLPLIYDVHGKNDVTVIWNATQIGWLDSLQANHVGGAWYWDQRTHSGTGSNFIEDDMQPNYYRFATNISYPAFSNCSINQDPGNGSPSNGDDYGAVNGYLDWKDNINDRKCYYNIHVFLKDLYVAGVLDPEQYSTCTTDITFRRLQNFHPTSGMVIKWNNFDDVTGAKLQSGSFTYTGGLITLPGITVKKNGNFIKLSIKNCSLRTDESEDDVISDSPVSFSKSWDGYTAHVEVEQEESAWFTVYDLMGRIIWEKKVDLGSGMNEVEIPKPATGIFIVQVKGETIAQSEKLFF